MYEIFQYLDFSGAQGFMAGWTLFFGPAADLSPLVTKSGELVGRDAKSLQLALLQSFHKWGSGVTRFFKILPDQMLPPVHFDYDRRPTRAELSLETLVRKQLDGTSRSLVGGKGMIRFVLEYQVDWGVNGK